MSENTGRVKQIIGPVVDVSFANEGAKLPEILNALSNTHYNYINSALKLSIINTPYFYHFS